MNSVADLVVFWELEFRIVEDFQNVGLKNPLSEVMVASRHSYDFEENSKSQFLMRIKDSIILNSSWSQSKPFLCKMV